jgi:hypothetical protein
MSPASFASTVLISSADAATRLWFCSAKSEALVAAFVRSWAHAEGVFHASSNKKTAIANILCLFSDPWRSSNRVLGRTFTPCAGQLLKRDLERVI